MENEIADSISCGRRNAFDCKAQENKKIRKILEHLAEKSGEDDIKDEFQFGILVDEYVPMDWWDK
jgi:hypothetical protein